jgi:Fur family ferric uptake transcriptional regulator
MSHNRLNYTQRLHERGFRVTPQRQTILDAICAAGGHTTLEEVWTRVHAGSPVLNRATVYRTLEFLRAMRLIVALELDGVTYYEIAGEAPHHHLVCRTCGQVSELEHALIARLGAQVRRRAGFIVDTDHVALHGQCAACHRKAQRRKSAKQE